MIAIHRGSRSRCLLACLAAILVALVAHATPALAQDPPDGSGFARETLLEQGLEAMEAEEPLQAIGFLEQAIEENPKNLDACLALAQALESVGDSQGAFDAYGKALKIDRTNEAACLGYAARSWDIDRELKGIQVLTRLLKEKPDHVEALAYRGYLYQMQSKSRQAIRDLARVAQEPSARWTLTHYAGALFEGGDFAAAQVQASRAIEYDETDDYAYWVRGYVRHLDGDIVGATWDFQRAVELDPDTANYPYEDLQGEDELTAEEAEALEALGALLQAALVWAVIMGLIGLVVGLGGSRYLVPPERRVGSGIQPAYDGPHKELFTIYVQNVALTLVTFGIYRFWAKVRTRRFHLSHTVFAEGRFDYHATGMEKFVGFLKGMVILVPFGFAYYHASGWVEENPTEILAALGVNYGLFFALFLIRPLALVGAQRFNLARTSWNNLRFRFTGTLKEAYKLYLGDAFLILLTLGIYWSWHLCKVKRFKLAHTTLGEERLDFTGKGSSLFGIQVLGGLTCAVTLGLYVPWYIAERHRFWTGHTKLMGKRFHSTLSGKAVLAVGGPGLLASIFTLGLALPWAVTRWRRMIAATTLYAGTIELDTLTSIQDTAATSTLEGIGEAGELFGEIGDLFGI